MGAARVDLGKIATAEHEAVVRVVMAAVQAMEPLRQRWEADPTPRHKTELVAALEQLIPLQDLMLVARERWITHNGGRWSDEELERARYSWTVADEWIGLHVDLLNRVESTPTVG